VQWMTAGKLLRVAVIPGPFLLAAEFCQAASAEIPNIFKRSRRLPMASIACRSWFCRSPVSFL